MRSFIKSVRRYREKLGKSPDFDWLSVIEGLHGNHRYHVHFVCDYYELSPAEVCHLWRFGFPNDDDKGYVGAPVLLDQKGFFRLADYFNKEAKPVGKRKYSCSRSLDRKIEQPVRWREESGTIMPSKGAVCISYVRDKEPEKFDNGWGKYNKLSWLVPDGSASCIRALQRMGITKITNKSRARARARTRDLTCKSSGK